MCDIKILSSAKRPEIFCAYTLLTCVLCCSDYVVGDIAKEKLPDIFSVDKKHGIEIVQAEKECDFKIDRIWKLYNRFNGDFIEIKKFCDAKYPNEYILQEFNGKVGSFSVNEGAHSKDWMKDIYRGEIRKKLKKLHEGYYAGITGEMDLCVSIIQRSKDEYDAKLVLYQYFELFNKYNKGFNKIFVITSSNIFIFELEKIKGISPIYYQDCIVDFNILGENYCLKLNYDYNDVIEKVYKVSKSK